MRNAPKRVGLLASTAGVLAVIATGVVLAAGTASASVHAVAYRLTANLTPNQVVPAAQAPAGASGRFHGILIMSGPGAIKAAALAGCKVVSAPKRSGLPFRINCGAGAVGTIPGAAGQWRLIWRLSVSHLSGPATGAFIHLGASGQSAAPSFKLCAPCTSTSHGVMALSATHGATLSGSSEYVDVTTAKNPGGEIRGQITRTVAGYAAS
jgi:hypothetical protein